MENNEQLQDKIIWKHYKSFKRKHKTELPIQFKDFVRKCMEDYHEQKSKDAPNEK